MTIASPIWHRNISSKVVPNLKDQNPQKQYTTSKIMGVLFLEDIQSKSGNGPTLAQNTVQLKIK